jgi:preprotein translocase subunit SecG
LILLVMVQRGKGGGLAGAFGGMGGQSAFGTKAGDLFTRVTIGVAFVWIVLCMVTVRLLGGGASDILGESGGKAKAGQTQTTTAPDGASKPAPGGSGAAPAAPASGTGGAKPAASK